jgi:adenosylcobyric acid synthase
MKKASVNPHGGNLMKMAEIAQCSEDEILDFSANLNPLGFPEWVRPLISSQVSSLIHYPDPNYTLLKKQIADRYQVSVDQVILANGATEIFHAFPQVIHARKALLPVPSYGDYEKVLKLNRFEIEYFELPERQNFTIDETLFSEKLKERSFTPDVAILGNPNNPTGQVIPASQIELWARSFPQCTFIVDESFIDFTNQAGSLSSIQSLQNFVVVYSATKIFAIPGLRIGFAIASPEIARGFSKVLPDWSVNTLAAKVLEKGLQDSKYLELTRQKVTEWRDELSLELKKIKSIQVYPSNANFLLIRLLNADWTADALKLRLLQEAQVGIRECSTFIGLDSSFFRIAVKRPDQNERLISAFCKVFGISRSRKKQKKTPALMFQGTASNVGKSLLTAALCRVLCQDGLRVAPFKSQNMALNSFVTFDGMEMGRAQVLQAQAARILPDVRMNPILLKPSSESDSQVILNGKPLAHLSFKDYTMLKEKAFLEAKASYDSLASEYQVMILEGAGSASEVNLKRNDLVNMRMAEYAGAHVILVGNIDHGGIFGSFFGTLETLAEWERERVAGFLINRFRGIKSLLQEGINYVETYTGKPVLGVVSHLKDLNLPEEDSLEFKSGALSDQTPLGQRIDIALIDIPRISNFTDVDALRGEPDIRVRRVRSRQELGSPDVVLLPGSKSVATDLAHLKEVGLAQAILKLARDRSIEIVGICGGYQMLGERILDPHRIESSIACVEGLGLLALETQFEKEKCLLQCQGRHRSTQEPVYGYEIHHGATQELSESKGSLQACVQTLEGRVLGHSNPNGKIWGTYLHGIFDADGFRRKWIDRIRLEKGWKPLVEIQYQYDLEKSLNRLAEEFRNSVDLQRIYSLLEL